MSRSAIDNACIPGCNTTRNLYRQDAAIGGGCVLCPPGTQSNGGVGLAACVHCPAGSFYDAQLPGCAPCAVNTTTVWLGAAKCMSTAWSLGSDGAAAVTLPSAPTKSITATPDGRLYGSSTGILRVTADSAATFATTGGSSLVLSSTQTATTQQLWSNALGTITTMAVVERPAFSTQVLVAGGIYWMGATCYAVSSLSLYNPKAVTALMHYDVTLSPPVLWLTCQSVPIVAMTVRSGTGWLYMVWGGLVWRYNLDGSASDVTLLSFSPTLDGSWSSVFAHAAGGLALSARSQLYFAASNVVAAAATNASVTPPSLIATSPSPAVEVLSSFPKSPPLVPPPLQLLGALRLGFAQ